MKLEDITLKIGDILTFDDGFVDSVRIDEFTGWLVVPKKELIVKVERYETFNDKLGQPAGDCHKGAYYILKTIWERKEELSKEELQQQISVLQRDIDLLNNDISTYYSKIISARDKAGYIKKELSKIQSEVAK